MTDAERVLALLLLGYSLLGRRDCFVDPTQPHGVPGPQGAEAWQIRGKVVHVFEYLAVSAARKPTSEAVLSHQTLSESHRSLTDYSSSHRIFSTQGRTLPKPAPPWPERVMPLAEVS
ncbi:hypothetical protein [Streptomyces atratus]|uniref:hypothetical protein n=1 Tax=Streptomyces atratus TaxID=1893 RepID=UPI00224D8BF8|nr:hypothetical protein [Streptomyces atratus]MCX5339718.1 hypothetical protein [Streptomyces atratus]